MLAAAKIMSGVSPPEKKKCIVEYEMRNHVHTFTIRDYETGALSQLKLSNLLFDNGFSLGDISDINLTQRENSCWTIEFAIHNKTEVRNILTMKKVTFIDHRLWVADNKLIRNTRWKHPYTEMANGMFNARCGHCSNTVEFIKHLITVGCDIEQGGTLSISKINKHGFMQVETDNGLVTQHLNNFDELSPEDVRGVWYNDSLGLWVFEDTEEVNCIPESYVYLLLDTHSRQPRYCAKNMLGPVYTYDYTLAKAFFSETEAIKFAKQCNSRLHTTFTVDQWI